MATSKSAKPKAAKDASKPKSKKTAVKSPAKAPQKSTAKAASKPAAKLPAKPARANGSSKAAPKPSAAIRVVPAPAKAVKLTPFLQKQREKLLILKDTLLDSMNGVARDSLRSRAEGSEASAFGMHQADAGSDAYDRDFALSLLSQEQDSLYEIDEALKRVDNGTYGTCEMSGKPIPKARLEALPFTRYTVECQAEIEKRNRYQKYRQPVTSLFGLGDEDGEGEDEETTVDSKD